MGKRIAIGLPFLNAASTLMSAVRSIFAQSFEDWELILMDDGSSDGSLELARQIRDSRVRVVSGGGTIGLSRRLNEIAQLATCDRLARMDADDIMHPERLERQSAHLDANPEVDVLGSAAYVLDEDGCVAGIRGHPAGP